MPRICLITPGHISSTPRLVKEADALAEAGYDVRVVAGKYFPPAETLDHQVLKRAKWTCRRVDLIGHSSTVPRKIQRLFARYLIGHRWTRNSKWAAHAHHAHLMPLVAAAIEDTADLYLGHCLGGLAAAGMAAEHQRSLLGFDIEDIHGMETDFQLNDPAESLASSIIQETWIPRCDYLSASSEAISKKYLSIYGTESTVFHNVFPLCESPAEVFFPGPVGPLRPARLYWFSQVVGPHRGLEEMVRVISQMKTPVELHLRGICSDDYKSSLNGLAARHGLKYPILFQDLADPAQMAVLAAHYDLGLSLELTSPPNRDLCLTNKVFCYLMAGIPQWMSHTTAQYDISKKLGVAALAGNFDRPEESAAVLDAFFSSENTVNQARLQAWKLSREIYCWDVVKQTMLSRVDSLFKTKNPS